MANLTEREQELVKVKIERYKKELDKLQFEYTISSDSD